MRVSVFFIILFSSIVRAEGIKQGLWINTNGDDECIYFMRFNDGRYKIHNDCYGPARTGIVESGLFRIDDSMVILTDRLVVSEPTLIENQDGDIKLLYTKTKDGFTLTHGKNNYTFQYRG